MNWYDKISDALEVDDYSPLLNAIDYYENQLVIARKEVLMEGNLEKMAASLPGIVEYRYSQLQEIEAVLELFNIKLSKEKGLKFREYLEHYNRALSSRDAEKYAEAESSIIDIQLLINQIALIRNKYLAIFKGLENKSFQINNILELFTKNK